MPHHLILLGKVKRGQILLKIHFSQNTTNLLSIIYVATCFDS
jgi:hypothetical protein